MMKIRCSKTYASLICFILIIISFSCSNDENTSNDESITEELETINEEEDSGEASENSSIEAEILRLVNNHRGSMDLQDLEFNGLANTLAHNHTLYMVNQNDISHDDFDARSDRLFNEENATRTGENVAYGQRSAQAVMDAWLDSPGHRENIEGDFTHIGIAVVRNSRGVYYFTQLFLKKR